MVLAQTITLQVPVGTFVQVWSPNHPVVPTTHDGVREWRWTSSQTRPSQRDANGKMTAAEVKDPDEDSDGRKLPSVAWTTFHNWAEVGDWYRGLIEPRMLPTAAIRAKAEELTKDAKTPEAQAEALYRFVASQIRYVSISFGTGRIQPHAAAEVLANGYGDCKDKDTLLESLLRAKGFVTAPVLIGAGIAPLPDVPTPAVFNHEITTVQMPGSGSERSRIWLDTTSEVAPFRVLLPVIRDQMALVVPTAAPASLQKTPGDSPFPYVDRYESVATLDTKGVLKGHIELTSRSDSELGYRLMLQRLAPAQWDDAMQYVSNAMSLGGKVSHADLRQNDSAGPVHLSYDYTREDFGDWKNNRIYANFPALEVVTIDKDKAPEHDIDLGAPRTMEAHSVITLPVGDRADLPAAVHVTRDYMTYDKTYLLSDGKLIAARVVVVKRQKLAKDQWKDYLALTKACGLEEGETYVQLIPPSKPFTSEKPADASKAVTTRSTGQTVEEVQNEVQAAYQRGDWDTARSRAVQAEVQFPDALRVHSWVAFVAAHDHHDAKAIEEYRAELKAHPDSDVSPILQIAGLLYRQKRYVEEEENLKPYLSRDDARVVSAMIGAQTAQNHPDAALATTQGYLANHPDDRHYRSTEAALLRELHREPEAAAAAKKAMDGSDDPLMINNNVYLLSEMKVDLPFAETSSRRSVDLLEKATATYPIAAVNSKAFGESATLVAAWDTLGYILLLENKPEDALPYFEAAWFNQQDCAVGNHLGQVYEVLGRKGEALAVDRLALSTENAAASKEDYAAVQANIARLEKAGVKASGAPSLQSMRTFSLKKAAGATGGGSLRLQLAGKGVADAMLVTGDASLKSLLDGVKLLSLPAAVPPGSPAHVLHDAVVFCGKTVGTCDLVLMPHSGIRQEGAQKRTK